MFACLMVPPAPKTVFTAGNVALLNAATAFGSEWGAGRAKFLIIPSGVTIGPLTIPTGLAGSLTVINEGEIQGLGGAPNGGDGGDAITGHSSFALINRGAVRGGGGAGGQGGDGGVGGNGSYQQLNDSGFQGATYSYCWIDNYSMGGGDGAGSYINSTIYWGGVAVGTTTNQSGPVTIGGYTYYKGASFSGDVFQLKRTWYSTVATYGGAGGAGGNGGRGRGYAQTLQAGIAGAAGAPGGTNAGAGGQGGTGGTGGDWGSGGAVGSTGQTGANGTVSNGAAGAAGQSGGAPGDAVNMIAGTMILDNTGTINGAVP